jgi:hypothetical protein
VTQRFSPTVFAIAFCGTYIAVFALDSPLFRYYPLHGDFHWGRGELTGAGPGITWFGMLAASGIVALLLAVCIPEHAADKLFRNKVWLFACAAMLCSVFLLRRLFA